MERLKRERSSVPRVRFSLRPKLALLTLVVLALPWAGMLYVNEVERFLLEGQEQTLLATARAVATALHERPQLLSVSARESEVADILLGAQRASARIWVVSRSGQVVAAQTDCDRSDRRFSGVVAALHSQHVSLHTAGKHVEHDGCGGSRGWQEPLPPGPTLKGSAYRLSAEHSTAKFGRRASGTIAPQNVFEFVHQRIFSERVARSFSVAYR